MHQWQRTGASKLHLQVPLPPPLHYTEEDVRSLQPIADGTRIRRAGEQMAASYINFYIANGGIVMPAFGGEAAAADARSILCVNDYKCTSPHSSKKYC